ncbi:xibalbin-1-like isoform X1 [Amblyomma americanum]
MQSQLVALTLVVIFFVGTVLAVPYNNYGEKNDTLLDEYKERLENYLMSADKRSCIRRGGTCDGRPNDCCHQSACRCNLWGTNCRCQRAGLFQSLGKK